MTTTTFTPAAEEVAWASAYLGTELPPRLQADPVIRAMRRIESRTLAHGAMPDKDQYRRDVRRARGILRRWRETEEPVSRSDSWRDIPPGTQASCDICWNAAAYQQYLDADVHAPLVMQACQSCYDEIAMGHHQQRIEILMYYAEMND